MDLNIVHLNTMAYEEALHIQRTLQQKRIDGEIDNTLLIVEHPAVLTLGKRGERSNIKVSQEFLEHEGIDVIPVERGGDITYHGPGQMVGYLIIHLKESDLGIRVFIDKVQEVFISYLQENYGITAEKRSGVYTGVWIGNEKLTAIGISVRRAVTLHGFAFNVNTNLDHFGYIVPCGLADSGVTSVEKLTGEKQDFEKVCQGIADEFCKIFEWDAKPTPLSSLMEVPIHD